MDRDFVFGWLEVLDELSYYDLFGVEASSSPDAIKAAFYAFADIFHPDRHGWRPADEQRALATIFTRGTEAYLVLEDSELRAQYDAQLAKPSPHPPRISYSARTGSKPPSARLDDRVRSPTARPFVRRAQELVQKGDLKQAKLQMVMANHHDPDNDALEEYLQDIESKLKALARG
jgi:curved DNA-binding protein CbpA